MRLVDADCGLERIHWVSVPDDGESFNATVGLLDGRNVLRFAESQKSDELFAAAAAQAVERCLRASALRSMTSTRSWRPPHRVGSARRFRAYGVPEAQIIAAEDQRMHTASLAAAFERARITPGRAAAFFSSRPAQVSLLAPRCIGWSAHVRLRRASPPRRGPGEL